MSELTLSTTNAGARAGNAIGAMILSFFGTAWLSGACLIAWPEESPVRTAGLALVVTTGAVLFFSALQRWRANRGLPCAESSSAWWQRRARQFHLINAGQWIAVLVAVNVLHNTGLDAWVLPALIAIVGVHFLLLAPVLLQPRNYLIGVILILAASLCPWLGDGSLLAVPPAITGLTLWIAGSFPREGAAA